MSDALFTENRDFEIKFRAVMFWLVQVCPEEAPNMVLGFLMLEFTMLIISYYCAEI